MRQSLYWDDFEKRARETADCIRSGHEVPVRRVAIFITDRCNLKCSYCNHNRKNTQLSESQFDEVVQKYGDSAILHITGGEPSVVDWLYPYLEAHGSKYRFHLNTNAVLLPPARFVRRLKVSLDSCDASYWNRLVGRDVFDQVVKNIQSCLSETVVSITFTMTRENYRTIPDFIRFVKKEFPGLYATFFSVYKGSNRSFAFTEEDAGTFFSEIKPEMDCLLDEESRALLNETIEEKFRLMQGERFPENRGDRCYLALSERVILPDGSMAGCSHLVRDGVCGVPGEKHERCRYGCNRRLVAFNQLVEELLKTT